MNTRTYSAELDLDGMRSAVRFPLHLPVRILSENRELAGTTENISASGVLFRLQENLSLDVQVEFLLEIPAGNLCGNSTAAVHCLGRVVRSYQRQTSCFAAAVIDEYRFQ
jgi:PilZ domain